MESIEIYDSTDNGIYDLMNQGTKIINQTLETIWRSSVYSCFDVRACQTGWDRYEMMSSQLYFIQPHVRICSQMLTDYKI